MSPAWSSLLAEKPPTSLHFSSDQRCSSPFSVLVALSPLDSPHEGHVLPPPESPHQLDTGLHMGPHQHRRESTITSHDLLATLCPTPPWRLLAAFDTSVQSCLVVSMFSASTTRSCSAKLAAPGMSWDPALFLPRCRTLHLLLFNFTRFLSAPISSLSSSLGKATQPSTASASLPDFASSAMSPMGHSVPLPRTLLRVLNPVDPTSDDHARRESVKGFTRKLK